LNLGFTDAHCGGVLPIMLAAFSIAWLSIALAAVRQAAAYSTNIALLICIYIFMCCVYTYICCGAARMLCSDTDCALLTCPACYHCSLNKAPKDDVYTEMMSEVQERIIGLLLEHKPR
jgi:hypothetical protein